MPERRRLPDVRCGITRRMRIGKFRFYATVNLYEDGLPGEIFLCCDQTDSTVRGFCNVLSITASMALQRGVPVADLAAKWAGQRFEPSGWTGDPAFPHVESIADFLGRWLLVRFPSPDKTATGGAGGASDAPAGPQA